MFVTFSSLYSFSGVDTSGIKIPYLDKMVHFVFYFGATIFGVLAIQEKIKIVSKEKKLFIAVVFSILFGIIIEAIQYKFTATRHGDIYDIVANSLGALLAAWVFKRFFSKYLSLK